jgi:hypothetical protein
MAEIETEGWFSALEDGRLEIFLKTEGPPMALKVRASGPASEMYELADWFERVTGLKVTAKTKNWRRQSTGPKPLPGQDELFSAVELSSDATVASHG